MPKTISPQLLAHLAQPAKTTTICWLIESVGAVDFRAFTLHDKPIDYTLFATEYTYSPIDSGVISQIRDSVSISPDNLEVIASMSDIGLSRKDLEAGFWDGASIWIFLVNYKDLTMGDAKLKKGILSTLTLDDYSVKIELRDLGYKLSQRSGRLVLPDCDADLGDTRCGFNIAPTIINPSVSEVIDRRVFKIPITGQVDGYYNYAPLTWTSGTNQDLQMEIDRHFNFDASFDQIELFEPMPFDIQVSDTMSFPAGCDKTFTTCKNKFNNVVNFRGHHLLPGLEKVTYYPPVRIQ